MPPNNTAINTPAGITPDENSPLHQRPLTPLSYLSSPVPDLAATLYTQAADEADEANASFLRDSLESLDHRSRIDPLRDPRHASLEPTQQSQPPQALPTSRLHGSEARATDASEDVSRRERLQRVLARLSQFHQHDTSASASSNAYGNRTPSPPRQSIYDWAPAAPREGREQQSSVLGAILAELRRDTSDTHQELLRVLGQNQLDGSRDSTIERASTGSRIAAESEQRGGEDLNRSQEELNERRRRERERINLRSRAVMQRARQESSPSSEYRIARNLIEHRRNGPGEEQDRPRGGFWYRPETHQPTHSSTPGAQQAVPEPTTSRDRQERVEAFRRGYLAENVPNRLPRISTPPALGTARSSTPPTRGEHVGFPFAENALKYLSNLRGCTRYEDALSNAIDHGLATKEFFADKHDDFIMNLDQLNRQPHCSWMQPGAVFEGHQHSNSNNTVTHVVEQINPNARNPGLYSNPFESSHPSAIVNQMPGLVSSRDWMGQSFTQHSSSSTDRGTVSSQPTRTLSSNVLTRVPSTSTSRRPQASSSDFSHDHWPVRVTIHTVDEENMTIQGTMEAYDVPQHFPSVSIIQNSSLRTAAKAGNKHHPITTYLEGQIIDLRNHSFLTPQPLSKHATVLDRTTAHSTSASNATPYTTLNSKIPFPHATPTTDAENWRRLPPFSSLTTDVESFARLILSTERMEQLNQDYIFMRWKERCFVHKKGEQYGCSVEERGSDEDRGHGLTISGFYYCCLRRADGVVEGLYYDPGSAPAQCLKLQGAKGGWGSWEFR